VLLLLVASLLMAGCGLSGRAVAEPPTPTEPAPAVSPTARPPRPSPTAIPPPSVVGRVTPPPTPPSGVRPRLSLALDGPPWAAQAGLFLARERGFYVEAGLDVFFHVTSSRASALSQLASGRDELGLVGGDDLLRARAEGTPAVSLLALDASPPDGYGLVLATTEPSRERSPEALKSFVLATARGYAEARSEPENAVLDLAD
jgi:ABC-type nitrate/sulfonate/bicarbonate transport system substrate-binding protein